MKTILVAEDNATNRELLTEILEGWGYQVKHASNGLEVFAAMESAFPDLILVDIQMPEMDGYGVVKRLRRSPRFGKIPVIALTAYAMQGDREKALAKGFDGYITKPIDLDSLRRQIEVFCDPRAK